MSHSVLCYQSCIFNRLWKTATSHLCSSHVWFCFPEGCFTFSGRDNANKYHFTLTKFVGKARRSQYSFWKALRQLFLKLCSAGKEKRRHIKTFISGLSVVPRCVQKSEEKFYVPIICAQPLKVISGWIFLAVKLDTRSEFQPQRRRATGQKQGFFFDIWRLTQDQFLPNSGQIFA